jgi:hypothetical protein
MVCPSFRPTDTPQRARFRGKHLPRFRIYQKLPVANINVLVCRWGAAGGRVSVATFAGLVPHIGTA